MTPGESIPCNHVHVRYGACRLRYGHARGHQWVNAPRPWWVWLVWLAIAAGVAWVVIVGTARAQTTCVEAAADHEIPGGAVDGATQFFTLRRVPIVASVHVHVNGVLQSWPEDYAVYPSTKRIGFFPAAIPAAGDRLKVDYRYCK